MGSVSKYIRIKAPPARVYELWRDPTEFPGFMPDVKTVEDRGSTWHWEVDGPLGTTVAWDTEIVEDLPGERLAWKSVGGQVRNAGGVRFDDRDGETDLEYAMEFDPPGGTAGEVVAKIFKDPEDQVQRALDAFKELVEREGSQAANSRAEVGAQEGKRG